MAAITDDSANMWAIVMAPNGKGVKTPALADSGSRKFSFISRECLNALPSQTVCRIKFLDEPKRIATATGDVSEIKQAAELRMRMPSGTIIEGDFLILNTCPVPIILGHDKLATMDEMARQVKFAGKEDKRLQDKYGESTVFVVHEADSFFTESEEGELDDLALLPEISKATPTTVEIPFVEAGSAIDRICKRFPKVFSGKLTTKPANVKPLGIKLREGAEFPATMRERLRPIPLAYQSEVDRQLKEMTDCDVIEEVRDAEHYSQLLVVRKKDGALRLCIDYRGLNSITVRNRHPIPLIKDLVARLRGQKMLGVLDMAQGYWQTSIAEDSRQFTTFATPQGMFRFKRVAFGLCNAPTYFQSAMQREVLRELHGTACLLYIDDIIILGKSESDFLKNLEAVLKRLEENGISIKPSKCRLGVSSVEYVGLLISGEKVEMTPSRKKAISEIQLPRSVTKLRSFLGLLNYFREHIRDFSRLTAPLYELLLGNPAKKDIVQWSTYAEECFQRCKAAASNAETLYHLQPEGDITLRTDASDKAMGGILTQTRNGKEYPILFISKKLSAAQQRYSTSDKEMLSIFYCIRACHQLLAGRKFEVLTDHRALQSTKTSASARVERMKLALAEYEFKISYIKGSENSIADLMSRPDEEGEKEKNILPIEKSVLPIIPSTVAAVSEDTNFKQKIISAHHNSYTGHLGRDGTIDAIRASGYDWMGLKDDVSKFIHGCVLCQKGRPMAAMRPRPFRLAADGPNREWSADVMELEPVRGYTYILVIICNYSRFIHLTRMRSVNAAETVEALENLFAEFGSPERFRTDNGTNFKNESINELLENYGVQVVAIAPYESRSNSIVERAIREVRRHIYGFTHHGFQWPDIVKKVQFIMNRTPHSATGFSPADILFGQLQSLGYGTITPMMKELMKISPPERTEFENHIINGIIPPAERDLAANRRQQADLQAAALERIQASNIRPTRQIGRGPEVGDRVWIRVRLVHKNSGREHWTGPAQIISITGEPDVGTEIITVRMADGGEQRVSRAKIRIIPKGIILEERTEGAVITSCSSWEPNKPPEHYKIRVKRPDGSLTWEEVSVWLRRPEFQEYALSEPYLTHLVLSDGDAC